ncbi:MAG: response regulator [Cyanobacteria bacterium P01_D01_bin.123]
MRLLLVDDDEPLMDALANELIQQRYAVDIALDSESCRDFLALFDYDLAVLDVGLPQVDGITLCQQLRTEGHSLPILMLSAEDGSAQKVAALNAGADDYVVKPFDFAELTARIHALLRRDRHVLPTVLQWGALSLNPQTFEAAYREHPLHLTPKEFALLEQFLRHSDLVFSIDAIIENLWSFEDPPSEYAVRTHIKGLRQKLTAVGAPKDAIETVYGVGYRLNPTSPAPTQVAPSASPSPATPDATAALARAWTDYRDAAEERLRAIEAAIAALQSGHCERELRQRAAAKAHQLVGSLGSFGFTEGSAIVRPMERLLEGHDRLAPAHIETLSQGALSLRQLLNTATPQPNPTPQYPQLEGHSVLLLESDRATAESLCEAARAAGLEVIATATSPEAREAIATERFSAAVVHLICDLDDACATDGTILLEELHCMQPPVPTVVVLEGGNLPTRLEIARSGGHVVSYPAAPESVLEAISLLLQPIGAGAGVLVVDDDPQFLSALQRDLAPWQFQLATLDDPTRFWQVLEDAVPDVLVLDVAMPDVSGIELCQMLRSDLRWQQLPAIFLTAREDAETQNRAFASGADDFIVKPVAARELAHRILNRLERARLRSSPILSASAASEANVQR